MQIVVYRTSGLRYFGNWVQYEGIEVGIAKVALCRKSCECRISLHPDIVGAGFILCSALWTLCLIAAFSCMHLLLIHSNSMNVPEQLALLHDCLQ